MKNGDVLVCGAVVIRAPVPKSMMLFPNAYDDEFLFLFNDQVFNLDELISDLDLWDELDSDSFSVMVRA